MKSQDRPYFYAPELNAEGGFLPEQEARHALRSLRMTIGDELIALNGRGELFFSKISSIEKNACAVEVIEVKPWRKPWQGYLSVCIAPTKQMERMEWLVEKLTEMGVDEIVFIQSQRSERKQIKSERLERVMVSAIKQSQQGALPQLRVGVSYKDLVSEPFDGEKMIMHCIEEAGLERGFSFDEAPKGNHSLRVLIGPEGDFSQEEVGLAIKAAYHPTTLGENRLRTETAALMAGAWFHLWTRKK